MKEIISSCGGIVPFISLITAVVGTLVAIFTAILTSVTIRASNKQAIFERRLDVYSLIKDFYDAYKNSNYSQLTVEEQKFKVLTDSTETFAGLSNAILDNEESAKKFSRKSFEVKRTVETIDVLWRRRRIFGGRFGLQIIKKHKSFINSAREFVELYVSVLILLERTYSLHKSYNASIRSEYKGFREQQDEIWEDLQKYTCLLATNENLLQNVFEKLDKGHFNKLKDSIRL